MYSVYSKNIFNLINIIRSYVVVLLAMLYTLHIGLVAGPHPKPSSNIYIYCYINKTLLLPLFHGCKRLIITEIRVLVSLAARMRR